MYKIKSQIDSNDKKVLINQKIKLFHQYFIQDSCDARHLNYYISEDIKTILKSILSWSKYNSTYDVFHPRLGNYHHLQVVLQQL